MTSFKEALLNVISNPKFIPPNNFFELDLASLRHIISYSREMYTKFAIGEAKLVLPIFEAKFPDDSRPRDAIATSLSSSHVVVAAHATHAAHAAATAAAWFVAADDDDACKTAAASAAHAAYAAFWAAHSLIRGGDRDADYAANAARRADPSVTLEDQLRRVFNIMNDLSGKYVHGPALSK